MVCHPSRNDNLSHGYILAEGLVVHGIKDKLGVVSRKFCITILHVLLCECFFFFGGGGGGRRWSSAHLWQNDGRVWSVMYQRAPSAS